MPPDCDCDCAGPGPGKADQGRQYCLAALQATGSKFKEGLGLFGLYSCMFQSYGRY